MFLGLISDLFPNIEVPRKRDPDFEKAVKAAACDLKLQPEDSFILKICQLDELLKVRHSVFIIAESGSGKTKTWLTLVKTYKNLGLNPNFTDLNPKAVSNDELYGVINPATREWKDGLFREGVRVENKVSYLIVTKQIFDPIWSLMTFVFISTVTPSFSVIMRDLSNLTCDGPKYIILDGDIDPMWIESLNTVMDDNKILTLASNERIALTNDMRLIFEISSLKSATPATVSRAGILYINPGDLGWNPFVTSWIEKRENSVEKTHLNILFDKYVPILHDQISKKFKKITPISGICHVQVLCALLDALITPNNTPSDSPRELYEIFFVFAAIWSYGSALYFDGVTDFKIEFSKFFTQTSPAIKFPPGSSVFDVWVDPLTTEFVSWTDKVPKFELDTEIPLQACLVHNSETVRLRYFLDIMVRQKFPTMLVGLAGCGKTLLVNEKLGLLGEEYAVANVPFNFYYTAELTQKILEKPLEKKAGKNYGPPGSQKLIYFLGKKVSNILISKIIN